MLLAYVVALLIITAQPLEASTDLAGGSFTDDDGNVHEGYIEAIASVGITKGCNPPSNYLYCPDRSVTRGQMAAFIARALRLEPSSTNAFSDDDDSIFEEEINALAAAGVAKGCDPPANTRFCPDDVVTRGQMAAFIVRAFDFSAGRNENHFADDDGSVFEGDIDRLATADVTRGCDPPSNQRFCPSEAVERDQMATFLGRSLGLASNPPPAGGQRLVVSTNTLIEHERLVLRSGDSIEFRNGSRLMIGQGASVDWQGTPTATWSQDGKLQNLRRDLRIFGQGDIMFMRGSKPSTIRFVEADLQPLQERDHYPLHWHHAGEGSRGTLVEGVVVKNSTNRAFVPHASHGITFRDTIAKNIAGEAYWWNPPPANGSARNNSNDIVYEHALADGITNLPGDPNGHRLSAFNLPMGTGNTLKDSVAINIRPTKTTNCAGFNWPEGTGGEPSVWTFEGNKTLASACNGIFVWQNDSAGNTHFVDDFASTQPIEHGAYRNDYRYRNVDVPGFLVHAVGWSVEGGHAGDVVTQRHRFEGTVTFTDVTVNSLEIRNGENSGENPAHYVFNNTGLECSEVRWLSWVDGTTVDIDGVTCPMP